MSYPENLAKPPKQSYWAQDSSFDLLSTLINLGEVRPYRWSEPIVLQATRPWVGDTDPIQNEEDYAGLGEDEGGSGVETREG